MVLFGRMLVQRQLQQAQHRGMITQVRGFEHRTAGLSVLCSLLTLERAIITRAVGRAQISFGATRHRFAYVYTLG